MRIVITSSAFDPANLPADFEHHDVVINETGRRPNREELKALLADGADGTIAGLEPYDADVLAGTSRLRAVSRIGTGVDNVDLHAAARLGIAILRTPEAPTVAVAELTVGLILAGLRDIAGHHRRVVEGAWRGGMGGLLEGRTVGLVGAGRIAQAVAQRLAPFGVRVQGHDPFVDPADIPFPLVGLEQLLRTSDITSLHVPAQSDGGQLLDAPRIAVMRPGAMLINTARGGLVDEDALAAALASGALSFACLDAFEIEPYNGPLLESSRVLLTPHIGSATSETRRQMEREAAVNLALALGLSA